MFEVKLMKYIRCSTLIKSYLKTSNILTRFQMRFVTAARATKNDLSNFKENGLHLKRIYFAICFYQGKFTFFSFNAFPMLAA